jgi:hypothetical protein
MHDAFIRLVADSLKKERFALVDVGCSGGIEPIWRLFGERFAAIGFDASVSECRRLATEETSPNVHYVAGFVGLPADHPFARRAAGTVAFSAASIPNPTSIKSHPAAKVALCTVPAGIRNTFPVERGNRIPALVIDISPPNTITTWS